MRPIQIDRGITLRDEQAFNRYLSELDRLELISAEEEVVLARRIRQGDRAALERLVRANLRFVVSCAKKYQRLGLPMSDLVSEGNLGLLRAAELFDETKGFKFISYAVWWIRQAMVSALSNQARLIRLPGNMVKLTAEIRKAADQLEQQLERLPTEGELSERVRVDRDGFGLDYAFGRTVVSLDAPLKQEGDDCLWSATADPNAVAADAGLVEGLAAERVSVLLAGLSLRERRVVTAYFGIGSGVERSLEDIAWELGITGERARQLKVEALEKLQRLAQRRGEWG